MGSPIELTVVVFDDANRSLVDSEIRGLLVLKGYDAYVDTVNMPENEIEVTVEVSSPKDGQKVKKDLLNVKNVKEIR